MTTNDELGLLEFRLRFALPPLPDKTIRCPANWTVLELKQFLYEDCPSKPAVDKQRLIYAGHCLADQQILKEIFSRNAESSSDTSNALQVVLFMCASNEQIKAAKRLSNNDSFQNRQEPSVSGTGARFSTSETLTFDDVPQNLNEAYAQAYHNYLRNYYSQSHSAISAQSMIRPRFGNEFIVTAGVRQNVVPDPQVFAAENNVPPAELNENVDFLDLIYKLVRYAFLAAIVFYSSMDRIIFVIGLICLMWFVQMRRERDNRNAGQNEQQRAENVNRDQADNNNNGNDNNNNELPAAPPITENRLSAWSVFWSTVVSFFSSLIPEPVPMDVN